MDNTGHMFFKSYEQLLKLSRQQLDIVSQERNEEQLAFLNELEEQKKNYRLAIDQYVDNEQDYRQVLEAHQATLVDFIEQLQLIHAQLQQKITNWYNEDSQEMKQVANQRKTLHAYGGVANSDIIPYYFDEKK